MINDFILKACKKELANLGFMSFEYINFKHSHSDYLIYHFKLEYKNSFLYFVYHAEPGINFNFEKDIKSQIDSLLDSYYYTLSDVNVPTSFILIQTMSKLGFDQKRNFKFNTIKLGAFIRECSFKYKDAKEFVRDLDNIDLIAEMGAY